VRISLQGITLAVMACTFSAGHGCKRQRAVNLSAQLLGFLFELNLGGARIFPQQTAVNTRKITQ
jgi:hypothetical protein